MEDIPIGDIEPPVELPDPGAPMEKEERWNQEEEAEVEVVNEGRQPQLQPKALLPCYHWNHKLSRKKKIYRQRNQREKNELSHSTYQNEVQRSYIYNLKTKSAIIEFILDK